MSAGVIESTREIPLRGADGIGKVVVHRDHGAQGESSRVIVVCMLDEARTSGASGISHPTLPQGRRYLVSGEGADAFALLHGCYRVISSGTPCGGLGAFQFADGNHQASSSQSA
ncbi:hypothetical protein [Streptomyces zagrosensis]|uniref:Uncharacterized protein n=1 Tax=Streptomyces zagrosensis TaxID=1042984 RepID=A0A7W9Q7I4_9ACTN|nr:hypothetical protein [Streptomyces zagrosensis]MBB5935005.1 hypothetical protein [Streptomyces zagrosensis]